MSANGANVCTIDCQGQGRAALFLYGETITSVFQGFRIVNAAVESDGGAVFIANGSSPAIRNCVFTGNSVAGDTASGGAVFADEQCAPVISGCVFYSNTAAYGGAVAGYSSSLQLLDCAFSGNTGSSQGGAVHLASCAPVISNCQFASNSAGGSGGAVFIDEGGGGTFTNCLFTNNSLASVPRYGAAIYAAGTSNLFIGNCTFSGNSAGASGAGGALFMLGGTAEVTNCIMWDDVPAEIYQSLGSLTVSYSDIKLAAGVYPGTGNINSNPLFASDSLGSEANNGLL